MKEMYEYMIFSHVSLEGLMERKRLDGEPAHVYNVDDDDEGDADDLFKDPTSWGVRATLNARSSRSSEWSIMRKNIAPLQMTTTMNPIGEEVARIRAA